MKTKIIYVCEQCRKESTKKDEILACEAQHHGLSVDEKAEWDYLERLVEHWSNTVSRTNNERTRATLESCIVRLLAFETEHHVKPRY